MIRGGGREEKTNGMLGQTSDDGTDYTAKSPTETHISKGTLLITRIGDALDCPSRYSDRACDE